MKKLGPESKRSRPSDFRKIIQKILRAFLLAQNLILKNSEISNNLFNWPFKDKSRFPLSICKKPKILIKKSTACRFWIRLFGFECADTTRKKVWPSKFSTMRSYNNGKVVLLTRTPFPRIKRVLSQGPSKWCSLKSTLRQTTTRLVQVVGCVFSP